MQSHFKCTLWSPCTSAWDSFRRAAVMQSHLKSALRSLHTPDWETAVVEIFSKALKEIHVRDPESLIGA